MTLEQLLTFAGGGGVTAVIVALVNKFRSREDREAITATAEKNRAEGAADVLTSVASAFTEVTGGLREEIERLQGDAGEIRQRAVRLEAELDAALKRVDDLEHQLDEARLANERLQADLDRVRGERDAAIEKCVQQEGEIRQLKAVIEAQRAVKG
jgi:chromosome segregation ATPase